MGILVQGNSGVALEVEPNTRAVRVVDRPYDVGSLGSYRLAVATGAYASTSGTVFSFRWGNASNFCVLKSLMFSMGGIAGFTAGTVNMFMQVARSWSASDTGGTAVTPVSNDGKARTSFGTSLLTDARVATTGTLTAGTRTAENAYYGVEQSTTNVAGTICIPPTYVLRRRGDDPPVVFAQNEGFIVVVAQPATGTATYGITVEWDEIAAFDYG